MGKLVRLELFSLSMISIVGVRKLLTFTRLQIIQGSSCAVTRRLVLHLDNRTEWIWQIELVRTAVSRRARR